VAVKVFRLDITPEQAQSLAEELSRAADAGLFHPSIIEPIAAGVEGTVAYRAEEYVAAETLDVAMRHYAPAAVDKVLPFITQLAGAIDFARAAGVGHGALHPRDVFVTPEEARASGFGVVDALERVGLRAPVRRPYTAPERIDGGTWGTPADVFSLAAITYELLTARRPSGTGAEIGALGGAVVGGSADALLAVLVRAMDADPARRHATALAFAGALEGAAREDRSAVAPLAAPPEVVAVSPAVVHPPPKIDDDIAFERDADDAHHQLSVQERERAEAAAIANEEAGEEDPEAHADRLLINAAAVASDDSAERYRHGLEPPGGDHELDRPDDDLVAAAPVFAGSRVDPWETGRGRGTVEPEREYRPAGAVVPVQGTRILPLAMTLSLGLLVGFAVGYGVGARDPEPEPVNAGTAVQPAPSSATAGRVWSEQTIPQPQAGARQQPPTTPPPVPSEAPVDSDAGTRPLATSGRVVVRSTPSRAAVTVNGRWQGRTPLIIEKLPFGPYSIRVVQPGYAVAREDFVLSIDDPSRTLSVRLQPQAPPSPAGGVGARRSTARPAQPERTEPENFSGSIFVDSRPRGARVFVDGRAVGDTPLTVPDVRIGSHVVRLELADHRSWSSSTRVTAGQQARVTGSMERVR
jgi:PEGA domain-containing protein/protein kinase-like protein